MDSVKIDKKNLIVRFTRKVRPLTVIIMLLGGLFGYLFFYYTKCCADDMALHINPFISVFYGLLFGALISYKGRK